MATVTGNLAQITGSALVGLEARIQVLISENAVYSSSVVVTRPAPVTPDGSGNFTVNLIPSSLTRPLIDYSLLIKWLDSAGNFVSQDLPNFTFRVPSEGGVITDLIVTRPSAYQTWTGTVPPPELGNYLWWYNPLTGDFYEWTD